MADTKLYSNLNLPPTATDEEIKKSYRKLAKEFHPDKNPAAGDKFKEISFAYEVLSDPEKKLMYDRYGLEALQNGMPARKTQSDFLNEILGGLLGHSRRGPRKAEDTVHCLKVTLEDLYNGKTSTFELNRSVNCSTCAGKGTKGSTKPCRSCNGKGFKVMYSQLGNRMVHEMQMKCDECHGECYVIPEKDRCLTCSGQKTVTDSKILEVYVEKGMRHGQKITFKGEGDRANAEEAGDVIIVLDLEPHSTFKREGCDLLMMVEIGLTEALCGFSFAVKHLDGRNLVVKSPPGKVVSPDAVMGLEGEGMPLHRNPTEHGNLYIKFTVTFPSNNFVEEAKLKDLEWLLPDRPPSADEMATENTKEVDMLECEETKSSSHQAAGGEAYDEDDDQHIHMDAGSAPRCGSQ